MTITQSTSWQDAGRLALPDHLEPGLKQARIRQAIGKVFSR
jgi:hypothetical protein